MTLDYTTTSSIQHIFVQGTFLVQNSSYSAITIYSNMTFQIFHFLYNESSMYKFLLRLIKIGWKYKFHFFVTKNHLETYRNF